jgi:putative ABC transport system permease protein
MALAIGIGSATAIYTVINALLLKTVPFEDGELFVSVLGASFEDPNGMSSLTLKDALEFKERTRSFDVFGCFVFADYNLTAPGEPQHLNGVEVDPSLVNGLGVSPYLGRWFQGAVAPTAVLSYPLWIRLGRDANITGKTVTLNGHVYTVMGVMPPGFNLPLAGPYSEAQVDIWLPLDPVRGQSGHSANAFCYARLRPGIKLADASAEVKRIAADIARREPSSHPGYTARVDDLHGLITKDIRPILVVLFAASVLLLLITCANVGGLLVARAVARARETAVRVALGAGIGQLAAQYCLEGLFIAVLGAAGGLLLTFAVVRILLQFGAQSARIEAVSVDWRVALFALGTAVLAGMLASMAPLWQATRMLPNDVLTEGVRTSAGARSRRLSRSLVVGEIALAFVLLSLSAVLIGELYRLMRVSPGFDPDHLLTMQLTVAPDTIPGKPGRVAYQERLVRALEAVPGVTGAGVVNQLPLDGCCLIATIYPEGLAADSRAPDRVNFILVSPEYFRVLKIPLRRGRFLEEGDRDRKPLPVVIDQATAKRYWPNRDPIGLIGHFGDPNGDPFQVSGVVGDVKNNGLDNDTVPEIYLPAAVVDVNPINLVVRSPVPAKTLVPEVVHAIHGVNPGQPVHNIRMMSEIVRDSMSLKRAASYVMTFFAIAALVMATIGAYGVISYAVRQRRVELGTRMALGALPRNLLGLVVGSGLKMTLWGVAIGGIASVGATWLLLRNFVVNVGNGGSGRIIDPGAFPFLLSAALVGVVAMGSSFFPAWWASLLSPMVAIRDEPGAPGIRTWVRTRTRASVKPSVADVTLVAELIEAARRAQSHTEALVAALQAVRDRADAQSAMLLEKTAAEEFRSTVAVPDSPGKLSIPGGGLLLSRLKSYPAPLPITVEDLDTWRRWSSEFQPRHLPEIETLASAGVRLAVPLRTNKEVFGLLLLGEPARGEQYGPDRVAMLRNSAGQFALLLENARLTGRVLEQENLRRDLALAAEVQRRLLARQSLENDLISIAATSIPARSVGGDYFDLLELGGGRTAIALADVAGKGVPAALIMSAVQAMVRVLSADAAFSLPDLTAKMNYFLYRSTGPSSYATFFYAQVDQQDRTLRYVNAGHNAPYLLRVDASMHFEELSTGGTVIGMFPQAHYQEGIVDLRPGDVLMIFTDGVPEAHNACDEEFGEERLKGALRNVVSLPVDEMVRQISGEMKNWIQDAPQYDDLTFVMMKVKS